MPTISMFYGIVISLYYFDNEKHNIPHIHAKYQGLEGVFDIAAGEMIEGNLPNNKIKLIQAWIELHRDELLADWELAQNGEEPFRIAPLQ